MLGFVQQTGDPIKVVVVDGPVVVVMVIVVMLVLVVVVVVMLVLVVVEATSTMDAVHLRDPLVVQLPGVGP